ncbi:hypothetical protein HHI36_007969 [Cryptolaemus montrouzieri]|uniref:Uncharacterized protein n=1 Tax=Cryptolaemus montrouzieri TaxID=559131 RepID=A0ABD2MRN1_9CUCU
MKAKKENTAIVAPTNSTHIHAETGSVEILDTAVMKDALWKKCIDRKEGTSRKGSQGPRKNDHQEIKQTKPRIRKIIQLQQQSRNYWKKIEKSRSSTGKSYILTSKKH